MINYDKVERLDAACPCDSRRGDALLRILFAYTDIPHVVSSARAQRNNARPFGFALFACRMASHDVSCCDAALLGAALKLTCSATISCYARFLDHK